MLIVAIKSIMLSVIFPSVFMPKVEAQSLMDSLKGLARKYWK